MASASKAEGARRAGGKGFITEAERQVVAKTVYSRVVGCIKTDNQVWIDRLLGQPAQNLSEQARAKLRRSTRTRNHLRQPHRITSSLICNRGNPVKCFAFLQTQDYNGSINGKTYYPHWSCRLVLY